MKYEITLIETLLKLFEKSDEGKKVSITLPYTNIEKCFLQLTNNEGPILVYLMNSDLFELIKHTDKFEYYEEPQHKSINGRRFSLYGKFYGSAVIIDTSLHGHDYIWFVDKKQASIYLKHKLIIS